MVGREGKAGSGKGFMVGREGKAGSGKGFLVFAIVFSLILSVFYSAKSFTGYVITDEVNSAANLISLVFFLIGVVGALAYFRWFKTR
ncbi:MAG: hypothetical protein Q8P57_02300 [Candidatus Pacearchaeota archaeon]|nr:hypothetical protein [Candidatus Pacearchaeota archaeon]